ncbi:kinase-like domain-containing protein [Roridomyces roridus]|uniref:Kinase-like domain-containing protein n=1 Tax=Roridomyces roridus TaxID=1738132 RepID=A0AAD7CL28_9AGAR|nr:kinase-like domain-containing protein [Roridomyces roridus]
MPHFHENHPRRGSFDDVAPIVKTESAGASTARLKTVIAGMGALSVGILAFFSISGATWSFRLPGWTLGFVVAAVGNMAVSQARSSGAPGSNAISWEVAPASQVGGGTLLEWISQLADALYAGTNNAGVTADLVVGVTGANVCQYSSPTITSIGSAAETENIYRILKAVPAALNAGTQFISGLCFTICLVLGVTLPTKFPPAPTAIAMEYIQQRKMGRMVEWTQVMRVRFLSLWIQLLTDLFVQLTDGIASQSERDEHFHRSPEWYTRFLECRGSSAQKLLDLLQDLLDLSTTEQPRLLNALRRLSSESKLYPRCFPVPHLDHRTKVAGGAFSDVYAASMEGQKVAVKEMRMWEDLEIQKFEQVRGALFHKVGSLSDIYIQAFSKEAITWRQLSHPNVLPFYGLFKDGSQLCLVSPWMENRHIRKFLQKLETCETGKGLSLILDIALGLQYIHERGIIHGDLQSENILVTPALKACIADFGVSKVKTSMSSLPTFHSQPWGTGALHYRAPELHEGKTADFASDICSLGCVMHEILAGKPPFSHLRDGAVINAATNGPAPSCPPSECRLEILSLTAVWELVEACLSRSSGERPTAARVVEILKGTEIRAQETESAWSWDLASTSRFRRQLDGNSASKLFAPPPLLDSGTALIQTALWKRRNIPHENTTHTMRTPKFRLTTNRKQETRTGILGAQDDSSNGARRCSRETHSVSGRHEGGLWEYGGQDVGDHPEDETVEHEGWARRESIAYVEGKDAADDVSVHQAAGRDRTHQASMQSQLSIQKMTQLALPNRRSKARWNAQLRRV